VARTRFYSSVGTDGDDSEAPPLPLMPPLNEGEVLTTDDLLDGPPCEACGQPCSDDFDAVEKVFFCFPTPSFFCNAKLIAIFSLAQHFTPIALFATNASCHCSSQKTPTKIICFSTTLSL